MSEWQPTEQKLYAINSVARTEAGTALREYIENEVEWHKNRLVHIVSANDAAEVAYSQAAVRLGTGLIWLLTAPIEDLLRQHNINHDEGDEHGQDEP